MDNKYERNGLSLLLANRQVFMGLALIWIYLFHAKRFGCTFIDHINDYGWIGVDIFIFLSAIGLACSLEKNTLSQYFKNRFKRIIPTWIIVLILIHIIGLVGSKLLPGLPFHYPSGIMQCVLWYTGLGFWLSPIIGESPNNCYEWYVPTILVFYLIAPLLGKRSIKTLVLVLICSMVLVCLQHHFLWFKEIEIATSRLPIFITGFLYYNCCKKSEWEKSFYVYGGGIFVLLAALFYLTSFVTLRVVLALCVPMVLILISYAFGRIKHVSFITLIGSLSLEMYLLHLDQRPYYVVNLFIKDVTIANIVTFFVVLLAAFILSKFVKLLVKRFA